MKFKLFMVLALFSAATAWTQSASVSFEPVPVSATTRSLWFSVSDPGVELPILWGLDTAWPSEGNIRRGVSFMGSDIVGVVRVSFQPFDYLQEGEPLTERLLENLRERLRLVSLVNPPGRVKLALNNDGPVELVDRRLLNAGDDPAAARAYARLIYATMKACQDYGWEVVSVAPLNEPDYIWNEQGSMADFLAIARELRTYPEFRSGAVRISGGNTLNCDQALPWYEYLGDYIDEGNTHQLAGVFDTYASFFERVRADGKYAAADELHNVMEAMVGVEYGMQTGIWWGTAEYARGEFCKASFGSRLAYAENRKAWTSAAVYRAPSGTVQAFCGTSERQATPSQYRFVSLDRDVFYDGRGPAREFLVSLPGGEEGSYQNGQTNAECVVDISWGDDIRPVVDGDYRIMNKFSGKVMGYSGAPANFSSLVQMFPGSAPSLWSVRPVPATVGGDFSYWSIVPAGAPQMKLDVCDWSLEPEGRIILYDGGLGANEQWYLKYDGDGYFRILSRHSNLCLELSSESASSGILVWQNVVSDSPRQLWRFVPADAECDFDAPLAPSSLSAVALPAAVSLSWQLSPSADVASYSVFRADGGSDSFSLVGRGIVSSSFIDNTAAPGVSHVYVVKALDRSGNSSLPSPQAEASPTGAPALVASYSFSGDILDSSPNAFHAGHAEGLRFVNNSFCREPDNPVLRLRDPDCIQLPYMVSHSDAITVAMWMRWTSGDYAFDFGAGPGNSFSLSRRGDASMVASLSVGGVAESVEAPLPASQWARVAVVCGDSRLAVYVNGQEAASAPLSGSYSDLRPVLNVIGADQHHSSTAFGGYIDDLCIYNYALSPDEILAEAATSGVSSVASSLPVGSREYYSLSGIRVSGASLAPGLYIVRDIRSDGSSDVSRIVVR